jgi:hypothetical protein
MTTGYILIPCMYLKLYTYNIYSYVTGITSVTKKEIWSAIEKDFNSNATTCVRSKQDLSKKWENLTAKHRAIYSDYLRKRSQTGTILKHLFYGYMPVCLYVWFTIMTKSFNSEIAQNM